ncbi:MAG: GIY-YIG nuclease family protein [Dehalococcoidia bacterium]|nr:GIY-YIG nuclease family protein [Dehalococcoidia bacterium]
MGPRGTYAILFRLDRDATISVGRLGLFDFARGWYIYAGSALGGLYPRIMRHLREEKTLHWHVDYFGRVAVPVEVWYVESESRLECKWCRAALRLAQASSPVPRFGSSGCRCVSHLVYFPEKPVFAEFRRQLGWIGDFAECRLPAEMPGLTGQNAGSA